MKKKRVMLSMLCLVLIISLLAPIKHVNAEDDIEEYVIMTIDKETLKKVIKLKGIKQKDELINSEFLEDSNTAVVKMGEKKAKALSQKEKVLFVERNFLFFGQESMEDNEPENTMAETEYPFVEGSEKFNETEDETSQSGIIYNGYRKYANDFPEEKTGDYASPSFFDNISTDEIR